MLYVLVFSSLTVSVKILNMDVGIPFSRGITKGVKEERDGDISPVSEAFDPDHLLP